LGGTDALSYKVCQRDSTVALGQTLTVLTHG
jgi:hypothetical protein